MDAPLDRREAAQVLRYWLTALRHEEALATRPRARRPGRPRLPNLVEPGPGQDYFRIGPQDGGAAFFLGARGALERPFEAAEAAFFERWLLEQYRAGFGGGSDREETHLVAFPTIHFPRTDELAGLLRFRVDLDWRSGEGETWLVPSWRDRKEGRLPEPPVAVRLLTEDRGDSERLLPYGIDARLLNQVLGLSEEVVGEFLEALQQATALTPGQMVAATCRLLETDAWTGFEPADEEARPPAEQFDRLAAAVRARLVEAPGDAAGYPVAIVYDASRGAATWHLQRELGELLKATPGVPPWGAGTPLWAYLSGRAEGAGRATHLGLWTAGGLTEDQRDAAERFLGSRLTAVQGPPGTGKTELILNLAADGLVHRIEALAESGRMGRLLTVVASTNNRAVDNVIEPLSAHLPDEQLPLALRVGSQRVTAQATLELLGRCRAWLGRQEGAGAQDRLDAALARFTAIRQEIRLWLAPREAWRTKADEAARLRAELAALGEQPAGPVSAADVAAAERRLETAIRRLQQLQAIAERRGPNALTRLVERWPRIGKKTLPALREALRPFDHALDLPVPPAEPGPDPLEAWEEALDESLEILDDLRGHLDGWRKRVRQGDRRADLERALARLEVPPEPPVPPPSALDPLHRALFAQAVTVRELWAVVHRDTLVEALDRATRTLAQRPSFKRLEEDDGTTAETLRRLFPVIGSTLLSLGNAFPDGADCFERLIIDEAGQCHPAYALSGLMRCQRALVIGDVNQLEPVVRLGRADEARVRRDARVELPEQRLDPYRVWDERPASAQALADRAVAERPTLRDHFRCQRAIIEISDALCAYGLRVRTPPGALTERVPALFAPVLFVPIGGEQRRLRGSWFNPGELDAVESLVWTFVRAGVPWSDIAVVTPYVGQLEKLRQRLRSAGAPVDEALDDAPLLRPEGALGTGTVHRFQGGERRVVVFTTVVTERRSLRFLDARVNLVNVAVSRAKEHLVVVGEPETLRSGRHTRLLVERGAFLGRAF